MKIRKITEYRSATEPPYRATVTSYRTELYVNYRVYVRYRATAPDYPLEYRHSTVTQPEDERTARTNYKGLVRDNTCSYGQVFGANKRPYVTEDRILTYRETSSEINLSCHDNTSFIVLEIVQGIPCRWRWNTVGFPRNYDVIV